VRIIFTLFSFLKREIDWKETGAIILGIVFYQIGFAITGATQQAPIDLYDLFSISLFILGSYLNTVSEYQRKKFKENKENAGKLYTEGLFKYAQHINYFGDFVWILGFALMTRNAWALIMPIFCFIGFLVFNIPMLDNYLKEKYGAEYLAWNQKTKKFIPYIY
jgi:steroid 5-alpha reductase family enzyme